MGANYHKHSSNDDDPVCQKLEAPPPASFLYSNRWMVVGYRWQEFEPTYFCAIQTNQAIKFSENKGHRVFTMRSDCNRRASLLHY